MKKIIFGFNGLEKAVEVADVFAVHPESIWVEAVTEFPALQSRELEIEVKEVGDE